MQQLRGDDRVQLIPRIFLTNAASRSTPYRGPGRAWTIMAAPRPRYGEAGEGAVLELVPPLDWVKGVKSGRLPWPAYRTIYGKRLRDFGDLLRPGALVARAGGGALVPVGDGDTLLCCCSRAQAAAGCCHRCVAAEVLQELGWLPLLDGRPLAPREP